MSTRPFYNDEAHEYLDTVVCSDREKRHLAGLIAADDARLAQIMNDQHQQGSQRIESEMEFALRVGAEGEARVDEVMDELRDGTITPREAAKTLAEIKADVNRVREVVSGLPAAEERLWSEVNMTPGEHQRALARRAPALFKSGRGLLSLPTFD